MDKIDETVPRIMSRPGQGELANPITSSVFADTSLNLIQSIRLIHAICESEFPVVIPADAVWKFQVLKDRFGMRFVEGESGAFCLSELSQLSHQSPQSSIGALQRPLIFPHAIVNYCKANWGQDRPLKYLFTGLMTPARKDVISSWMQDHFSIGQLRLWLAWIQLSLVSAGAKLSLGLDANFHIESSKRGRVFPRKCWDQGYYERLLQSQFVLCPSGDFVWTYRFFEAVLCGAIPVVEEACPSYNGFEFLTFADDISAKTWTPEVAQRNFELCRQRITIPLEDLNEELRRLFTDRPSSQMALPVE